MSALPGKKKGGLRRSCVQVVRRVLANLLVFNRAKQVVSNVLNVELSAIIPSRLVSSARRKGLSVQGRGGFGFLLAWRGGEN